MKNGKPNYNERVFTKKEIKDIINSYINNNESSVKIGRRYNIGHKVILKVLHNNGVNIDQRKFVRKYTLNENFFDNIDTPNKAYILGFLFADGHNDITKSTITMSLQECDKYILELINDELGSNKELEFIDNSNRNCFGYSMKNQYRLNVFSKHMCNTLNDIGMVKNKSLCLEFPNIPENLHKHFIRGYFDGDGSYTGHITKEGKFQAQINFISTYNFCSSIHKILKRIFNTGCGNIYPHDNNITCTLSIGGNRQVEKIMNWLYEDAELYLKRKHDHFYNDYYVNNSLSA